MTRSIRTRLLLSMLALLVPLSAGAGWLLTEVFGNRLLHDIDVTLREEAETIAELLGTQARPEAVRELLAHIATATDLESQKYILITRAGAVVAQVPDTASEVLRSGNPDLRIVRYAAPDQPLVVTIAVSAAAALHAQHRLTSLLALGIPLLLTLCALGLALVTSHALRPLQDASRKLDAIGGENLSARVRVRNTDDEVGRLVTVLNRMLDRLQHAVEELRRFTADAAHELRTPLTVLRTGLDVAQSRHRSAEEYRAALVEALTATDRVCRLADDLLTLTRLETAAELKNATAVDVGEIVRELGAAWQADPVDDRSVGHTIVVRVAAEPGVWVRGNAGDLYRLFNNLIDNAQRYGAGNGSGPTEITIVARRVGTQIETTVADRGPGITPEDLQRVFDRFYRGDGAHTAPHGSGLGLSIAQQIAHAHGGHITAANRDSGGGMFTVVLPALSPPTVP